MQQRAYSLPAGISAGTTATSLSSAGVLVHSAGSVNLGELAVSREEYVTLPGSFDTGATLNAKNELLTHTDSKYRWDGEFPKTVPAGSTPKSAGGVGIDAWLSIGYATISYLEKQNYELWNFSLQRIGYKYYYHDCLPMIHMLYKNQGKYKLQPLTSFLLQSARIYQLCFHRCMGDVLLVALIHIYRQPAHDL